MGDAITPASTREVENLCHRLPKVSLHPSCVAATAKCLGQDCVIVIHRQGAHRGLTIHILIALFAR